MLKFEDHSRSEVRFFEEVWMNITVGKGNQFSSRAVYGLGLRCSLVEIVGSNPVGCMDVCLL